MAGLRGRRTVAGAVIGVAVIAAVAIAVLARTASSNGNSDLRPAQSARIVTTGSDSPGASAEALLQRDLRQLGSTAILGAHVGPAPAGVRGVDSGVSNAGDVLYVTVSATDRGAGSVLPRWEASLLGGALKDDIAGAGSGRLTSVDVTLRLPDGSTVPEGGRMGNMVSGQQFATNPADIERDVRAGARALGLQVNAIRFLNPRQPAPIVILTSPDPAGFVTKATTLDTWTTLLGDYKNYEAFYVEVRDQTGRPALIEADDNRVGGGTRWYRNDLRPAGLNGIGP